MRLLGKACRVRAALTCPLGIRIRGSSCIEVYGTSRAVSVCFTLAGKDSRLNFRSIIVPLDARWEHPKGTDDAPLWL